MAEYLTTAEVASALNVQVDTIYRWRSISNGRGRYAKHPFPEPDKHFGNSPVWSSDRLPEIRAWVASRPPVGRPPKKAAQQRNDS